MKNNKNKNSKEQKIKSTYSVCTALLAVTSVALMSLGIIGMPVFLITNLVVLGIIPAGYGTLKNIYNNSQIVRYKKIYGKIKAVKNAYLNYNASKSFYMQKMSLFTKYHINNIYQVRDSIIKSYKLFKNDAEVFNETLQKLPTDVKDEYEVLEKYIQKQLNINLQPVKTKEFMGEMMLYKQEKEKIINSQLEQNKIHYKQLNKVFDKALKNNKFEKAETVHKKLKQLNKENSKLIKKLDEPVINDQNKLNNILNAVAKSNINKSTNTLFVNEDELDDLLSGEFGNDEPTL